MMDTVYVRYYIQLAFECIKVKLSRIDLHQKFITEILYIIKTLLS